MPQAMPVAMVTGRAEVELSAAGALPSDAKYGRCTAAVTDHIVLDSWG